jgi:hypothetical protein
MIRLNIHLEDEDWIPAVGGWRCEALSLPGASLEALYHDGIKADTKTFDIENHIIRWAGKSRPTDLLATLSLNKDLPELENEKLQLEREKLNLQQQLERDKLKLEKQKAAIETKWKIITALGAILGSLLSFATAYSVGSKDLAKPMLSSPKIQTYATVLTITEAKCIEAVSANLQRSGFQNINVVKMGIYATKDLYNVFIGCNTDVNAIFVVVSGPDNANAKRIREEVKDLFP